MTNENLDRDLGGRIQADSFKIIVTLKNDKKGKIIRHFRMFSL